MCPGLPDACCSLLKLEIVGKQKFDGILQPGIIHPAPPSAELIPGDDAAYVIRCIVKRMQSARRGLDSPIIRSNRAGRDHRQKKIATPTIFSFIFISPPLQNYSVPEMVVNARPEQFGEISKNIEMLRQSDAAVYLQIIEFE